MTRSVASDLGLHCLPMSLLWGAKCLWLVSLDFYIGVQVVLGIRSAQKA